MTASWDKAFEKHWNQNRLPLKQALPGEPDRIGAQEAMRRHLVNLVHKEVEAGGGLFMGGTDRSRLQQLIAEGLKNLGMDHLDDAAQFALCSEIEAEMLGAGPLQPLMNDPAVSDILVNGPWEVWVDRFGNLEQTSIQFDDNAHLMNILQRLVTAHGRHIEEATPYVDARLSDGSRLHALLPPITKTGPVISIRKARVMPLSLRDLQEAGTLSPGLARVLDQAVKSGLNILVSGGASTGKTTLLNVLSGFILHHERIVTIEETRELTLHHPHVVSLETRMPNTEGRGEVTLSTLVRNALRMRADRILVGEVRSGEVFDMLQAMNVGHLGSMTTIHANSPADAMRRLEVLVLLRGIDLPSRAVRELLGSTFDIIIQLARTPDGQRQIRHVDTAAWENESLVIYPLFQYDPGSQTHVMCEGAERQLTEMGLNNISNPTPQEGSAS